MNNEFGWLLRKGSPDIKRDVDVLLWSFKLERIRRYAGQPFWDAETLDANYADRVEEFPRLETVAEHSWTLADAVLLLGWRFPYLHVSHAVQLAILHDKMEIMVGDMNPLGRDGTGEKGHAFDEKRQARKDDKEREAIEAYLSRLNVEARSGQKALLIEALECLSPEARYVKGLDKMLALSFILLKKRGTVADNHVRFLLRFTDKNNRYFPPLASHSNELLRRIVLACARQRGESIERFLGRLYPGEQLAFIFDESIQRGQIRRKAGAEQRKSERLGRVFEQLDSMPRTRTGIEAATQLAMCLNRVEDAVWGVEQWAPPRFVPPGTTTDRLYPIAPDSTFAVPGWLVDALVSEGELVFISHRGALEVQKKRTTDPPGLGARYDRRRNQVIYARPAADGSEVWDAANQDAAGDGMKSLSILRPTER